MTAAAIAAAVRERRASAADIVERALARIAERNAALGAFTAVLADRARARAAWVDREGRGLPLAGVPFAVKNLFDVAG